MTVPKTAKTPLRLRRRESLASGIRRIAREQIDAACRELQGEGEPRRAVHEARKALKKIRALLQLVGPEFGRKRLQSEKQLFRGVAKLLAPLRDADARVKTCEILMQGGKPVPKAFGEVRDDLEAETTRIVQRIGSRRRRAVAMLRQARGHVGRWPLEDLTWKLLCREIRRCYRKGRKALQFYQQQPSDENFHAWRKWVKKLWYHLRIVEKRFPHAPTEEIAQLEAIGELAGTAHDFSVLGESLAARKAKVPTGPLIEAIKARLPHLHQAAVERGVALFAEKPRDFLKRLGHS